MLGALKRNYHIWGRAVNFQSVGNKSLRALFLILDPTYEAAVPSNSLLTPRGKNMGRKLDALLGRNSKTSKLKNLAKVAISRISILKNQRQVRCSHAKSDAIELLKLGHQERALLRVEHVIKEQNMLDAFSMIENYCDLLIERVALLNNKECHDELKEGISSLIFAASRCGEFPELQKIRQMLTSRFGKDFADCAVELHNTCKVNPKLIQKLSARQPNLEIRLEVLKGLASEIGVTLSPYLEEDAPVIAEEKLDVKSANLEGDRHESPAEEIIEDEKLCESTKARKKYRNAAAAAQEAFDAAAYAAGAARAAVELSRSESRDTDPDDYSGSASSSDSEDDILRERELNSN